MNKYLLLIVSFALFFASCKKMTEFRIKQPAGFMVPKDAPIDTQYVQSYPVPSSLFQLEANGTDNNHLKELRLESLSLQITQPADKKFGFLKSIKVYMYAAGLPELEVAYYVDVPADANSLDMIMTGAILNEYAKRDEIFIKAVAEFDEVVTEEVFIKTNMTFYVRGKAV